MNRKGVVLLMILATILVAGLLASVIATIVTSEARFMHHHINRIKAYYGALAAMNLTHENLRTGSWGTGWYALCNNATSTGNATGCCPPANCTETVVDSELPFNYTIVISTPDSNGTRTININSNFTYYVQPASGY